MENSESQRRAILDGAIPGLVTRLAIPSVVMQIVTLVYNTVDTYFIAQIDSSAAAAVGSVLAIQGVIQAIGIGFGMGTSSLCSRKLGQSADEEANMYASSGAFGVTVAACLVGVICLLVLRPLLRIIGCTETMLPYAADYARVVLLFAPVSCLIFVFNNILRSEGHVAFSMYGNVAGTVVNLVLDPLFIFQFGWGTMGAALATSISQVITLGIMFSQFPLHRTVTKLGVRYVSRDPEVYRQLLTTGIPSVLRQGLTSVATALLCNQAMAFGDAAVAAVTIANKCYMMVRSVILGIGHGAQPVAGYNYGAGQYRRARAAFGFAIRVGTAFCTLSAAVLYAFSSPIMWWFCKDEAVLAYGTAALRFACLVIPGMAFSTLVNQEYQSLGFKKEASFLASCRQGTCFIPAILILPRFLGVAGVELAQPAADLLTFLISIPFFFIMYRRLSRDRKPGDEGSTGR